jgi:GT2 family glycosyltransferase
VGASALATIVVVPRERFSYAQRSLTSFFPNTPPPFDLIYVDAGTPAPVKDFLEREADLKGFRIISSYGYLSPNQARNLGWQAVQTKYTIFLDNDALVTPGWLEEIVRCAEETGAWVVGPLYLIGEIGKRTIHVAGGRLHRKEEQGRKMLYDEQYLFNTSLDALPAPLERRQWDYAEFHCMLVRTDVLNRLGPLDENLLNVHEHIDLCLGVREAGGTVYLEPKSVTSYVPPPPGEWWDLSYFMLRWSESWSLASVRHFNKKWNCDGLAWLGDKTPYNGEDTLVRFARGHRRLMTGLRINRSQQGYRPELPAEQAELIVALFLSVDRDCLNLRLETNNGVMVKSESALDPQSVFQRLGPLVRQAEQEDLSIIIEPAAARRSTDPALLQFSELDSETAGKIKPYAFLTLEVRPNIYECWLAVDKSNLHSAAVLREMLGQNAAGSVPPAERKSQEHNRRQFTEGVVGLMVSAHQLDRSDLRSYLSSGRAF